MIRTTATRATVAVAIVLAVTGVAGCSKTVSKSDVQSQITTKITDSGGKKAESVTCPNDLKGEVGAQIDCTMKDGDKTRTVNVTVTSIDGDNVKFDMVKIYNKDEVAGDIKDQLTQQLGTKPDTVTCPDNIKGKDGASMRCEATIDGQKYGVTASVDKDQGLTYKVDDKPTS